MTTPNDPKAPKPNDERKALERSEREANKDQPHSFEEGAMTEKIVEVLPLGTSDAPIKGIDPTSAD